MNTAFSAAPQTLHPAPSSNRHAEPALMPLPQSMAFEDGRLLIDTSFTIALSGHEEPRLERAALRMLRRLSRQTSLPLSAGLAGDPARATLVLETGKAAAGVQQAVEDESYTLTVTSGGARLSAPAPYGVLRGIETFLQLVRVGPYGFEVPAVHIEDSPRFPWRGLLIDVCRHWMPMEVIKRNLDAMAAVKLNVLHLHLSDDQGFRIESRLFPRLHEQGSDGQYYTQDEIRELIGYAADRGIRVVPELDVPGHATAWLVGHPELASRPGRYEIGRTWGVHHPTIDPTREETYVFLERFFGEMAALFPDAYFHIGGDEVTGRHWRTSPRIQAFIKENGLEDKHGLQAYFNRRVQHILADHGKHVVGWDEVYHPDLPKEIVIQSWRGQKALGESVRHGYQGILSFGYYLDHMRPASYHYGIDPEDGSEELSVEEKSRILGGEACMWSEYVSAETVDARIWPRLAAIAERLWSPPTVARDVDEMYRRLDAVSRWLTWTGVRHRANYTLLLERMAGTDDIAPLKTLVDVVEPVKVYERGKTVDYTQFTPLNRVVDAAHPESERARLFMRAVEALTSGEAAPGVRDGVRAWLTRWRDNHGRLRPLMEASFLAREVEPLSRRLSEVAALGLEAEAALQAGTAFTEAEQAAHRALLERAEEPCAEVLLMVAPAVRKLVEKAHDMSARAAA